MCARDGRPAHAQHWRAGWCVTASMATPALAASALRLRARSPRRPRGPPLLSGAFLRRVCQAPDHTARLVTYSGCAEEEGVDMTRSDHLPCGQRVAVGLEGPETVLSFF